MIHLDTTHSPIECLGPPSTCRFRMHAYEESAPPCTPKIHDIADPVLYTYAQVDAGESCMKIRPGRLCLEDLPDGVDGEGG